MFLFYRTGPKSAQLYIIDNKIGTDTVCYGGRTNGWRGLCMKILILQLSDMHCNASDRTMSLKIEKTVSAIKTLGKVDGALLVFSGDLSNTGAKGEIHAAKHLIGKLLHDMSAALKCGFIHTKIIPGNHDMDLPEDSRTAAEIEKWNKEDHLPDEIDRMQLFFEYAKSKNCFIEDSLCDVDIVSFGNVNVQVCLLNSAPFSTRTPTDKQFHYFPKYVAEKLVRRSSADLKITVMHHHYEWCEWDTKEMLKKAIASDDITFFGHDHKAEAIKSEYASGEMYSIIMGGAFNLDPQKEAAFHALLFDSESAKIENYEFDWSIADNIFIQKTHGTIAKKRSNLLPDAVYLSKLLRDEQHICESIIDYYVLPKLTAEGAAFSADDDVVTELSVEDIFEALRMERVVRITGGEGAGKSTLLKYLYYQATKCGFIPLLVENRDYKNSRIDRMFKSLFEEQYSLTSEHAYEYYLQADASSKIIFIDNLDLIINSKARENLISAILESGNLLVYTTREKNQDLEEIVKNKLQGKTVSTIAINPMYKQTRDCLIESIGHIRDKSSDEIEAIKMAMDYMAQSQTSLFSFTPGNAIQYIKFFLQEGAKEKKRSQTISVVFETNIRTAIIKACGKDSVANKYLLVLEYVANYMYFVLHAEEIKFAEYSEIITEYNTKKRGDINERDFLECCKNAHILQHPDGTYNVKFFDNNTYAYFVAKALNRAFEKDRTDLSNLKYVMEHICFGINDTIILFLSFIRSNTKIITDIAAAALKLLDEYPEWDFNKRNLPFLHQSDGLPEKIPSSKEKKEAHKQVEQVEKERHEGIKFRSIFDYDENDVKKTKYVVLRALKYTELVGRALIDQYGALDADEIDTMLTAIFSVPQKVIYATLKPYQDHCKEIIQNILNFAQENLPEEKIDEAQIRILFGQAGTILALNVLNDIAFNCSNESTITVLRTASHNTVNHKILQLMMEENTGDTAEFVSRAIALHKELDNVPYAKVLIAQIARKHIIYTASMDHREIDKLLGGKVLSAASKPNLLLSKGTGITNKR